jgi:hypothetical protein
MSEEMLMEVKGVKAGELMLSECDRDQSYLLTRILFLKNVALYL